MFKKILIANRGDNGPQAVAAQTHIGAADVMSEPNRLASAASGDRAAGAHRV
ncbi:MAG: hypothetical protein M9915_07930 [Rhizobacter sp.]|nr:hypothetical protein [Burkholderiaceae bacterium]MCO5123656.1 hypothetical protein [Rhizobacter sp.]